MRLVFFGSGDFGIPTLEALQQRHEVVRVVTQPPRPAGRGGKKRLTPVHEFAERTGIGVFCPDKPNTPEFEAELRNIDFDLAVVVAYGHLLKKPLLSIPRLGCVNLHASLLPAYRGAAPVPWAILKGEAESGVSVFQLDENFDTGAVIASARLPILADDTAESYLEKLAPLGADLMLQALDDIAAGHAVASPQDHAQASLAPKIRKEQGHIDWSRSFPEIERRVRAFHPWPHAFTLVETSKGIIRLNVLAMERAEAEGSRTCVVPGTVLSADPKAGLVVMTGDGPARLIMLQPEGKRPMNDMDFLRGHRLLRMNAIDNATYQAHYVLDALEDAGLTRKPANWDSRLAAFDAAAVRQELAKPARFTIDRLTAFLSPAATELLEEMAQAAYRLTRQRFGNAISLFAPLYVSNYCVNRCLYCGFNSGHAHNRRRLSVKEALEEARIIASEGFRDILLVSGEDREHIDADYLSELARALRADGMFATVSVEIYIQSEENYHRLFEAGIDGVTIFQETYNQDAYAFWHPGGPKSVFRDRILASEAAAAAGMRRMGLGVLLGLEDWRYDTLAMAVHADALARHYWRTRTAFSFPRIRPSESGYHDFPNLVFDRDLTQMLVALRLCFPDSGMTLSTRENPSLRNHLIPLGVTQISAGSKTNPGGYGEDGSSAATEQFAVSDERSAAEMATVLCNLGFDPVWKDWDAGFQGTSKDSFYGK